MSRQIKFRGKTSEGKWVYGDLKRVNDNRGGGKFYYIWVDTDDVEDEGKYVRIDRETVGQFTGLKDMNGMEIYEGDLVKAKGFIPETYRIEFIEGGFCLTNPDIEDFPTDISTMYPSYGCQIEVIGSIHDNPELLKGGI